MGRKYGRLKYGRYSYDLWPYWYLVLTEPRVWNVDTVPSSVDVWASETAPAEAWTPISAPTSSWGQSVTPAEIWNPVEDPRRNG